jgi:hypothetical protein
MRLDVESVIWFISGADVDVVKNQPKSMKDTSHLFSVTHPQLASKLLFIYSPTFSILNPQYLENMKRKAFNPSSLSHLNLKSEKMIYFWLMSFVYFG